MSSHERTLHPDHIVQQFLQSDPEGVGLLRRFQNSSETADLKVRAILYLLEASANLRPAEQALALAEQASREPSSADRQILLFLAWARLLRHREIHWEDLKSIFTRASALVSENTPGELKAWIEMIPLYITGIEGAAEQQSSITQRILESVDSDSPHYYRLEQCCDLAYYLLGMKTDRLSKVVPELSADGDPPTDRLFLARFVHAVQVGDVDEARQLAPQLHKASPVARANGEDMFTVAQHALRLLSEWRGLSTDGLGPDFETVVLQQPTPDWVRSTQALAAGDVTEALEWARRDADIGIWKRRTWLGFDGYTLIRSELACRNTAAAERLLIFRQQRGTVHYLDDFFFTRAYLLRGDHDQARHRLERLRSAIETHGAQGRLDYELRLSPEVSLLDLLNLSTGMTSSVRVAQVVPSESSEKPLRELTGVGRIIHTSPLIDEVCSYIVKFANLDAPITILGETGTGKELVARALHEESSRKSQPFLAINCGAISESLVESELFGHTKGAFSGADRNANGLFREAGAGTIFLDEIGEISPRLQVALLRVFETGEVRPLGSGRQYKIRCRIVTATNANLAQMVEEGRFRRDLMYRLNGLTIEIPPLRNRSDDIAVLTHHFLNLDRTDGLLARISPDLEAQLRRQAWPGNVRELRHAIERMRLLNSDQLMYAAEHLSLPKLQSTVVAITSTEEPQSLPCIDQLHASRSKRRRLAQLLTLFETQSELKVYDVAELLQVSRNTASRYLNELCSMGAVTRVQPTASTSTHYFVRSESP